MNRAERDKRGRRVVEEDMPMQTPTQTRKSEVDEREQRMAEVARAHEAARKMINDERKITDPMLAMLEKSGRTCANCAACEIRTTGLCVSTFVRDSLPDWDGIVVAPARFGCAFQRGKR